MNLFWDTSAILALIFDEIHTADAELASESATRSLAWRWLKVEAFSALARRNGRQADCAVLERTMSAVELLDLTPSEVEELSLLNRDWRLRAADAGHLHCFQQASFVIPDLQLVCFDEEMAAMARRLNLRLWRPPPAAPAVVRERSAKYGTGRKKRPAHR
jgi:predicted nucleic acid-binding protein